MIRNGSHAFLKPPLGTQIDRTHPLSQGLIGAWVFNEATGLFLNDVTGRGNGLTGVNSPTWAAGRDGTAGKAVAASSQYWANTVTHLPTANVSVVFLALVGASADQGSSFGNSRLDSESVNTTARCQAHWPYSGTVYWDFGGATSPNRLSWTPASSFWGSWHHMVFTAGAGGSAIYADGVLVASQTTAISRVAQNAGMQINLFYSNLGPLSSYNNSSFEMFGIYDRMLSAGEAAALYAEPFAFMAAPALRRLLSVPGAIGGGGAQAGGLAIGVRMGLGI